MTYKVFVDDNFHYMDESERYALGEYINLQEAIEVCKKIVDEYLMSAFKPGMTAQELNFSYTSFGEDPFILTSPATESGILFSAWDYARQRSKELCESAGTNSKGP